MKLPNRVQEAMQMQVEAERKKRAAILESEGKNFITFSLTE
jgi:regulator of protease activity HflC (stomatin/prohibitin superfamily)